MTDKQIIIDGVDVSKCEWFEQIDLDINIICTSNSPKKCSGYCKDNPNCIQKKFKRKEQECKELKKQINDLLNKPEIQDKILWKFDNEALLGSKDAWIYKLEQTLAEIKEIAEECYCKCNSMNNCNISCKYYNNCNGEFSYLLACLNKQISECGVEDE